MTNETRNRIEAYKKALPEMKERVVAAAFLMVMSVVMMTSASFAWITLSRAPEASGMQTTVAANGNLEIALAQGSIKDPAVAPGESQVGDSSAAEDQSIVEANATWGNLVNVSDPSYGLSNIALRPALLSAYNRTEYPLNGATYGGDGRVITTNDRYEFASYGKASETSNNYQFFAGDKANYGVRAITSVKYENILGNERIENYREDTDQLYKNAQTYYGKIVSDELNDVNTLDAAAGVTCISALEGLVTVFAQDQLNEMGLGNGTSTQTSCSPYLWYVYQMMLLIEEALEKEGKAIVEMANWQAYIESDKENTFATIGDVTSKTSEDLEALGVNITTLEDYKKSVNTLQQCIMEMEPMAKKCENPAAPEEEYNWGDIAHIVNKLVNIDSATINGYKLSSLNMDNAFSAIESSKNDPAPVVVKGGLLLDIEKRFLTDDKRVQANVEVTVTAKKSFITLPITVYGTVYTDAYGKYEPDYGKDFSYSESKKSVSKGQGVAKDTYGLAIDVWVRTNYPNAILTLEGAAKYENRRATITDGGLEYDLYTISVGEGDAQSEVDVYQKADGTWYYAGTMSKIEDIDMENMTTTEKFVPVIVGYEGENRVWEDWRTLLEGGYIEQDATTQGSGSCFVFYAGTPTEQVKIMEMLDAFNVAFMDQNGAILGTAKLNLNSAYANQGKVTVPLEVETGIDYTDETGMSHKGITKLTQNTPTMITALLYLNGSKLQNENVLSEGELQGQLNIQFGTDSVLIAPDNEELQAQARTITASVTVNGETITNGIIGGTEGLEYKAGGYPATVTLAIDGEQPERISGYFVRVINATQGTRGEEQNFSRNADGTWSTTFILENPGMYVIDTLIVDGVQYTLHDGTKQSGVNTYYPANRPQVHIKGLKITSALVTVEPGVYMTADSSKKFPVEVVIDAAVEPKQVSAQFFSLDNKKQYTAILRYDSANGKWVGSTNISSSGTYTLKYISVDGNLFDAPITGRYELYLGLTASVSTKVPEADRTYIYDENATKQFSMIVQLFDDEHKPIENRTGISLHYNNMSPANMTWTGVYYEGVLDANNPGTMTFKKLELGALGTITNVNNTPTFTALNISPVGYDPTKNEVKFGEKSVIGDSTPDSMTVQFTNGHTAEVWAVMENSYSHRTEIIKGVHITDNQNRVEFNVPSDINADGPWTLTKLMLQNCYDNKGNEYPITGNVPTDKNSLVFTLSEEEQAVMTSKIYASYNVKVTIAGVTKSYNSNDGKSTEIVSTNLTSNGAGTFLEDHNTGDVIVEITNYEGNALSNVYAENSALQIQHDNLTTLEYGGYTGANGAMTDFDKITVDNGRVTFDGMVLNQAGEYNTNFFKINIGGSVVDIKVQPKFIISSKVPMVTIAAITPTGTYSIDKTATEKVEDTYTKASGRQKTYWTLNSAHQKATSSISEDSLTATVYFKCFHADDTAWESGKSYSVSGHRYHAQSNGSASTGNPTVTISLAGISGFTSAKLNFNDETHIYEKMKTNNTATLWREIVTTNLLPYSWTTVGNQTRYIGYSRNVEGRLSDTVSEAGQKIIAGTITANTLTVEHSGATYTFTIPAITINNPY